MRKPAAAIALALFAALASDPRAGADVVDLHQALDDSLLDVQEAARLLLGKDRVGAVTALQGALLDADAAVAAAADPSTTAELGVLAAKVAKKVAAYRKTVQKALDAMGDPNAPDLKAVKAAAKAAKAGYGATVPFARVYGHGPIPVEVGGKTAGFHKPGDFVDIRIYRGLDESGQPCLEMPGFVLVDPYGNGSVVPGIPSSVMNPDGSVTVSIEMGPNGGPARLEVTQCGISRSQLLFNYGPTGTFAPKLTVDRFDGVYAGTYTGVANVPGEDPFPVSGSVGLSVAGGTLTVTDPGSGSGSVDSKGKAGITGGGAVGDDAYIFNGKFTATSIGTGPGTAVVGGSWFTSFPGGTAHGTWTASR